MTPDRAAVIEAVLFGDLDPDYLTEDEVKELADLVARLAMDKTLLDRAQAGQNIFSGVDGDTLQ